MRHLFYVLEAIVCIIVFIQVIRMIVADRKSNEKYKADLQSKLDTNSSKMGNGDKSTDETF